MMILHAQLSDGTSVCIREVRKDDEQRLREGIALLSPRSRYFRFFSGMREPPRHVLEALLDVDGYEHIAWGAIASDEPGEPAIGVVHAFRNPEEPSVAEFSVAVIDAYHGRGLARILTAVLLLDCQREGLEKLDVHVLPENDAALAITRSIGGEPAGRDRGVSHFAIDIGSALDALRADNGRPGLADVFQQWDDSED